MRIFYLVANFMDFVEVYESLLELFPQIDARALRAVAIEHNKDPNAAVEAVLEEIVPFFSERSAPSSPLNQSITMVESTEALGNGHSMAFENQQFLNEHQERQNDSAELRKNHGIDVIMSANVHSPSEPLVVIDSNATDTLQVDISEGHETEEKNSGNSFSENSPKISSNGMPQESDATVRLSESDLEKSDVDMSSDTLEEKSTSSAMTQSSQAQVMIVVEEIIEEARDSQKMLFTAMESVISLMRQVELKEQAVEQAKGESSVGGKDTMEKVEELKQILQHAKEANDMHAGEVYGEKAILGTELRELQSRVLSLSDKRDKSLEVLDEMRKILEVRLAAVENEIQSAEQEKLEKENTALKLLSHQELIMEKVVQESKILKQQAEENAKMQEFLVDRGRVVDMLQGEIAVICQDVRVLKEKFDENVPLSKSLFSSQTSFILASATSSSLSKSPSVDPVELLPTVKDDLLGTQDEQVPEEKTDREQLVDDGWDFFEEREINA
ncbi:Unknown protein [Striga hermonthica]|uniref:CUE domain-containing protein n=1 Tax=Striga hermonthica TaxID=68872 RepID=A0A9N7RIF1_STRHE|nr:Unknown protein [Striga hermonthica]